MKLVDQIVEFQHEIRDLRRDIHAHPELRFEEQRTADLVADKLTEWGIPVTARPGRHRRRRHVAHRHLGQRRSACAPTWTRCRCRSTTTFAHRSRHTGKMHACGHDGHTAMLLGAAKYLSRHRNFDGTVHLIFQPAEEGGAGAQRMIDDGLFEQCPCDAVFGMHNWPGHGARAVRACARAR